MLTYYSDNKIVYYVLRYISNNLIASTQNITLWLMEVEYYIDSIKMCFNMSCSFSFTFAEVGLTVIIS